ncbi:MAG: HPr(Ser) kinase/phosphatase [Salinibacterium sp.]|nr:HPr(Ser) kinase/phosphatase [Salinibacterium sp.]
MTKTLSVGRLFERLKDILEMEPIGEATGLDRLVTSPEVSSPGLVLAGYTERFVADRCQILGETEITYISSLDDARRAEVLRLFFRLPFPCCFITKGLTLTDEFLREAAGAGMPLFRSPLKTNEFYRRIKPAMEEEFAPRTTLHGSLADVYGVGLLLVGQSGIGKSECLLDLVERGHRMVADDMVIVLKRGNDVLIGKGHELQRHHMEIRGVGLVDIPALFGIRAVRQQKRIEVAVELELWRGDAHLDRTGLDLETTDILGVPIPRIRVALNPGKNITVILEVLAMNHLLRYAGHNPAEQFNERLIAQMRNATDARNITRDVEVRRYLQEDNE